MSVGHGFAVVVELPDRQVLLSDAGRLGSPYVGAREISSCLWSRGLTHIDAIVLSHNDIDHLNAVPELLERFSVGVVYVSPVMFNRETNALKALKQAISQARVPLREISVGQHLASGDDTRIDVLHPPPDGMGETENADSICLAIVWRGRRILLTGDLAPPGLETVVAEPHRTVRCDHGSASRQRRQLAAGFCRLVPGALGRHQWRLDARFPRRGQSLSGRRLDRAQHRHFRSGAFLSTPRRRPDPHRLLPPRPAVVKVAICGRHPMPLLPRCHWLRQCSSLPTVQGKNSDEHWQSQWHAAVGEKCRQIRRGPSCRQNRTLARQVLPSFYMSRARA